MAFCVWLISSLSMFLRFICLVACFRISLLFKAEKYSIVLIYTTFCLSVHQLLGIRVAFTLGLSWIMILWPFIYKCLCGYMFFSVLLEIDLGVELLGHYSNSMFYFLRNCQTVSKAAAPMLRSTSNVRVFRFLRILSNTW